MNKFYAWLFNALEGIDIPKQLLIKEYKKIKNFMLVGSSAAIINLGLVYFLIDICGLDTYVLRNIVNVVTMAISTCYAFYLNRIWTWSSTPQKHGRRLLKQYLLYNFITLGGIIIRIVLFALLDIQGVYHMFNVAFGIGIAAIFNFIMYDKHIFRKEHSRALK